jgi:putative ABC transport system permease protein
MHSNAFHLDPLRVLLLINLSLVVALFVYILSREQGRRSLLLGLRSLWLHKLRAALSVLGIIIGTSAVISLMAFGKGSMEDALEDIRSQGTTNVIVKSVKPVEENASGQRRAWVVNYGLTWDDYDRCRLLESVVGQVPMRIFPQEVRHLDRSYNARLVATTEDYARVNNFKMEAGRFLVDGEDQLDEGDAQRFRCVIVLGQTVAEELFPFEDVIGQSVVLNKEQYRVIGVIKKRTPRGSGSGSGGQSVEDFDKDVYIPIRTCRVRFGEKVIIRQGGSRTAEQVELHQITLTVQDLDKVRSTGEVVKHLLERYHQTKKDWEVIVPLDRLEEAERARDRYNMLLGIIASISLAVGGIGIMNIMLATVTERTREIGIRRALGAKRRDITWQFIVEAVVQTSIGGLIGTTLGLIIVFGAPLLVLWISGKAGLPAKLDVDSIFYSLVVAVDVGVAFGWYPARRASRLDPIEALRHN